VQSQAARLAADVVARGVDEAQGGLLMMRVPWLLVESPHTLKTNTDGEPIPDSDRLLFEVLPRAIRLHLPDDRLLTAGLPASKRPPRLVTPDRPQHQRRLLRKLLRAQHPPGHLGKRLAGLKRAAVAAGWLAAVFGVGLVVGAYRAVCEPCVVAG
jgi:hypothetical protein